MEIFFFASASTSALVSTQLHIQLVPGVLTPRREADHFLLTSAEVKNAWSYTLPNPIRLYGVVLRWEKDKSSYRGARLSTETTLPLPLFC